MAHLDSNDAFSGFGAPDPAALRPFYADVLGIPVDEDSGMLWLGIGGGKRVLVYPKPDHVPAGFTILNFPVDDVDAVVDELTAAGVAFEHYEGGEFRTDARGVMRGNGPDIAWFRDPAGNICSIIAKA